MIQRKNLLFLHIRIASCEIAQLRQITVRFYNSAGRLSYPIAKPGLHKVGLLATSNLQFDYQSKHHYRSAFGNGTIWQLWLSFTGFRGNFHCKQSYLYSCEVPCKPLYVIQVPGLTCIISEILVT